MQVQIWDREVECLPLPQLVEQCEKKLREARVISRVSRSPMYREKLKAAGVALDEVRTYADLTRLPFTHGREFRDAQARYHPDELACADQVRFWQSTSGTTGVPKWFPTGDGDIEAFHETAPRIMDLVFGKHEDYSLLYFAAPAPFGSEAVGYHFLVSQMLGDRHTEFIITALPEAFDTLNLARLTGSQALFAVPSMALLLAEGVAKHAGAGARALFRKEPSVRNLMAAVVASVLPIKAKNIYKFRMGCFYGEPLQPYRKALSDAFGFHPAGGYGASEFGVPSVAECIAQDGLHIYLDCSVPEIIPQAELDREEAEPGYVPQAVALWNASPGLVGELVLTSFSDAEPLIRYRISDLAEVVSTEPCACGRTHPRIRIRHRSDDIVNLGLIRFSIYDLKRKMDEVGQHGQVARWQLRITRVNSRAKAVVLVQPAAGQAGEALAEEVKAKLDELPGVKQAWERGLIAEPEVRLVEEVVEERTGTGKLKMAIYEKEFFGEV